MEVEVERRERKSGVQQSVSEMFLSKNEIKSFWNKYEVLANSVAAVLTLVVF